MSNTLIKQATELTTVSVAITNATDMTDATATLSRVNKTLDAMKEEEEKVTKPLKAALKAETDRWKPYRDQLTSVRDAIRNAMSMYQTAERKREEEAKAKITARVEKGTLTMDTAARKLNEVVTVDNKVATDVGSVGFRTSHVLVVTNESLIPRTYLVIDEAKVKAALKAGLEVPGARLDEVQVPVNRR